MSAQRFIKVALGAKLLLPIGCAPQMAHPVWRSAKSIGADGPCVAAAPADQADVRRATRPTRRVGASVPVVYYLRFDHPPLTAGQLDRILARAAPLCPAGQRVWFVYVTANWERQGRLLARAVVYFTPAWQTPRLRKGQYVLIDEKWADLVAGVSEPLSSARPERDASREETPEYWQVSLRDQVFGAELETPHGSRLPFHKPDGFTEEEIVELVDFLRTSPRQRQEANSITSPKQFHGFRPIWSFSGDDGVIEVQNGAVQGMSAGHGELLRCKRNDDGTFQVLGIGEWYS